MAVVIPETELNLAALPGQPVAPPQESSSLTDTLSISFGDSGSAFAGVSPVFPAPEQWSLVWNDVRYGGTLDIPFWFTELGANTIPTHSRSLTDRQSPPLLNTLTTDTWFLTWTETPVDTVQFDLWDVWSLHLNEISGVALSQTFPATEFWSLTFQEASQLTVTNALVTIASNDLWNIQWQDASSMFEQNATTDTWAITYNPELSSPLNIPATSDSWAITYGTETSALDTSGAFVVAPAPETWSLTFVEASALQQNLFPATADIWSLTFVESSAVQTFSDVELVDNWFLGYVDVSNVVATPMFSDLADTWSLAYQSEVSTVSNIPTIPIVAFDLWTITLAAEGGSVLSTLTDTPLGRVIRVGGTRRVVKVE